MNKMLELIKTRRSTRKYQARPVETEKIDAIVEAGRYAPSGGNNQTTHFFVIKDPSVLEELARIVKSEFAQMEVTPGMYPSLAHSIRASKGEEYIFHYNAPVLIVTANKKDYGNAIADCACALENMMLAANALDLGSCWINQLKWLNDSEPLLALFRSFGMEEDERVWGAVSIGYAETEDGLPPRKPLERKGNPVTMV
ncbi:MAG: nitroreductase [Clostridia bacterium]|nr:nitroreductase [Clostridia bacterium]